MRSDKPANIDVYIRSFPEEIQSKLKAIRDAVHKAAPGLQEVIKYGMPTLMYKNSNLVFFAAFKKHIGFYGIPKGDKAIETGLKKYKQGRGSVQFPIDQPMPLQLITRIVKVRVNEKIE